MKKSTKRFLIGVGAATAGAAVIGTVQHVTTKYLMKLAIDRQGPKSAERDKEKMMASDAVSQAVTAVMDAAQTLETRPHERVEITAQDGTPLIGHWYAPENPKRILIAMHGWRSSWSQDFGMIAPFWLESGCAVLFAEQRGQGNSGGEYMGFGLLERFDCLDWIGWVNERTEQKLPLYLGGISMGASTVLMTAGFDLPENVRGIIADCGFTSPRAIWKHVVENRFHLPYGLYSRAANDICKRRIQVPSDAYSTVEALRSCAVPVLLIHGTDDRFVPVEMTYENYKACSSEKQLFIVPGAEHGTSYLVDTAGYETAVRSFWNSYDQPNTL
ncbi:MAG: alpha/beta hydrolase [Ruminococcaceae bacterium]|nr:alpha/beta hydrolase [Oscillospiraceae bacterium]